MIARSHPRAATSRTAVRPPCSRQGSPLVIAERRDPRKRHTLECRARAEFEELPGMRLTLCQVVRLLTLPADACLRILDVLMREGLVTFTADGHYANCRIEKERMAAYPACG